MYQEQLKYIRKRKAEIELEESRKKRNITVLNQNLKKRKFE